MKPMFKNPILPGFYPDPSVCRVDNDFYLVNSTFAFFPGIPVSHSRDLVNWRQIGYVLDRPEQLDLDNAGHSRGLFAPTIRYHDGRFYVLCTNVDAGGNFIVTAENPEGPWSDPVWLDAPGIDPSIFFDDDGSAWYCGNRPVPEGPAYNGNWEIWVQQINTRTLKLTGSPQAIWQGALRDAIWPEGPHIYKKDGYYYLLIAEGGTCRDHAISVARATNITGPWEGKPSNPILTHRHLGNNCEIVNVGHGDLVDTSSGEWWMILLASRPYDGRFSNLGRETFLVPVCWENGWPWAAPETGMVNKQEKAPALTLSPVPVLPSCEHFDASDLPLHWLTLRTPREAACSLSERPGYLRLYCRAPGMRDKAQVSFAGRRQQHMNWTVSAKIAFSPKLEQETAGVVLLQNEDYQYRLEIFLKDNDRAVRLVAAEGGDDRIVSEAKTGFDDPVVLSVTARGQTLGFSFGPHQYSLAPLYDNADGSILSTEKAGGFVGTVIGVFASGNGKKTANHADIDWFEYSGTD